MSDVAKSLELSKEILEEQFRKGGEEIVDFSKRHFNGLRENALVYCLERIIELAKTLLIAAEQLNVVSVELLSRGIFDTLMWTVWIHLSEENAEYYYNTGKNELT